MHLSMQLFANDLNCKNFRHETVKYSCYHKVLYCKNLTQCFVTKIQLSLLISSTLNLIFVSINNNKEKNQTVFLARTWILFPTNNNYSVVIRRSLQAVDSPYTAQADTVTHSKQISVDHLLIFNLSRPRIQAGFVGPWAWANAFHNLPLKETTARI